MGSKQFFDAKLGLLITILILAFVTLFYAVASMFTSVGYQTAAFAAALNKGEEKPYIIIDAGHGGIDPGALGNGLLEKDINLQIALNIRDFFVCSGYKTVLTRSDDILLCGDAQKNKKHYDLYNRLILAQSYDNCIFVSIHMNSFPQSAYHGLQVFYSENNQNSALLAQSVQDSSKLLLTENKRQIKKGEDKIYLLEHLECPAILVECGFLSNPYEAKMLADSEYREKLSFCIYNGIIDFTEANNG